MTQPIGIIDQIKEYELRYRKVYVNTEFTRESIFIILNQIDDIIRADKINNVKKDKLEPIHIYIDSYGGCLHSYFMLASKIRELQKRGYKFYTYSMGRCMSAGFYTLILGDKRFAQEYTSLMVHDQRAFEYGYRTVRDKRIEVKQWEKEWNRLKNIIFEYTDITDEEIEFYVERGLDWDMDANEALKLNVVDEII